MEDILGNLTDIVSYFTLGILFFFVIWGVAEKVARSMVACESLGWVIGFCIATYGFWYPFVPVLRLFYLIFLAAVAVGGTGFSRVRIVAKWADHGGFVVAVIVFAMVSFEVIQCVVLSSLASSQYSLAGKVISWGLLIYGITGLEFTGSIIESMGLPRASSIQAAFILASVVFLPLEFPVIYTMISFAAIIGSVCGGLYFTCYGLK